MFEPDWRIRSVHVRCGGDGQKGDVLDTPPSDRVQKSPSKQQRGYCDSDLQAGV